MSEQIDIIIADLDKFTRGEVIALALNVNANLRENPPVGTPFATGWASANWVPSIGEPAILPSDNPDPQPAEIAARANIASRGLNELLAWDHGRGDLLSTNNVPYILPLNDGHSPQQAQPGFVQRAIEKAVRETYSAAGARSARNRRAAKARAAKPRRSA